MLHYSFSVFSILLAVVLDESIFTNANTAAEIYGKLGYTHSLMRTFSVLRLKFSFSGDSIMNRVT